MAEKVVPKKSCRRKSCRRSRAKNVVPGKFVPKKVVTSKLESTVKRLRWCKRNLMREIRWLLLGSLNSISQPCLCSVLKYSFLFCLFCNNFIILCSCRRSWNLILLSDITTNRMRKKLLFRIYRQPLRLRMLNIITQCSKPIRAYDGSTACQGQCEPILF